jgi:hypothetical protein
MVTERLGSVMHLADALLQSCSLKNFFYDGYNKPYAQKMNEGIRIPKGCEMLMLKEGLSVCYFNKESFSERH